MKMKSFPRINPGWTVGGSMSRRRFFRQSGAAAISTMLLSSCDNLFDKIFPSKSEKDTRDKTLAFFGDSLTVGVGGSKPLGEWVGEAFSERPIFSDGVNGQLAASIAVRQGGIPVTLSVVGRKFNGDNPVAVIKLSNEFLPVTLDSKVYTRKGTLAGVPSTITGKYSSEAGERYTVQPLAEANTGAPIETEIPDDSVFELEDAVRMRTATQVLWYGRNDVTRGKSTDDIFTSIKSSVNYIAEPRRYLVLGILLASNEYKGTTNYARVTALNDELALLYRNSYVPMTPPTESEMKDIGFTPTAGDLQDIERGNFPSRMRAPDFTDEIHLNNFGYRIVANRIIKKIKDLKY
ncbi:hypothetical protein SAMN05216327_104189 [Dyadobacter sp. SG02]|nr:hypothetical protein SAMN05216327_104189 [Dyadobacter sp. SG02]